MISSWRRRRASRRAAKAKQGGENGDLELTIPNHFRCPISLDLMKDPVTLATGITYDRENIETWIEAGNVTCPITNRVLENLEPIPNHAIRRMIQDWCVENQSYGIERIPTPRIPVGSIEVNEILVKITTAYKRLDQVWCTDLVAMVKRLIKESERNKRCIVNNGTASVLAAAFDEFSKGSFDKYAVVLEEILSALTLMFPLDGETKRCLGSTSALQCMVWFLKSRDLSGRRNAILTLKEVISSDQTSTVHSLADIEDAIEAVFKILKDPISPTTTKASLLVIYKMVTTSSPANVKIISRFVELGLVTLLLEMLVDSERSITEKALLVLDGICSTEEGRAVAHDHALTMPVLVKKILRISDLANEVVVSILWNLCRNEERENEGVFVEALQLGAFQKLLLLLQVGCSELTKEKTTELLKLLNFRRDSLECIDSMDYKNLKRPF